MRSKPIQAGEFIALTAGIMMLTAMSIDIMLPAFGEVRSYFGMSPDSTATAQIVTFFFLGQAGQLIFGPLSDRFGRLDFTDRLCALHRRQYSGGLLPDAQRDAGGAVRRGYGGGSAHGRRIRWCA